MNERLVSPLRYPGGKTALADFVEDLLRENLLNDGAVVEPYAGGAGLSLALLTRGVIKKCYLVEKDPLVYAFWKAVTTRNDDLCEMVGRMSVDISTWEACQKYKDIDALEKFSLVELGAACLFLNRTNFSGILDAKPIGGMSQSSRYRIGCRFNKAGIIDKIERIGKVSGKIHVSYADGIGYLKKNRKRIAANKEFVYIDPPYLGQGKKLYRLSYGLKEHGILAEFVERQEYPWVVSVDADRRIKGLYDKQKVTPIFIKYAVKRSRKAEELIITNVKHLPEYGMEKVPVRERAEALEGAEIVSKKQEAG